MNITADAVKQLRERTGAGMMECKKALVETKGDLDAAAELMRKQGLAKADKKAARVAAEGVIVIEKSADGRTAAMVEINCETDFVAREQDFRGFAQAVAAQDPGRRAPATSRRCCGSELDSGETIDERRRALVAKIGENISVRRFAVLELRGQPRRLCARHAHRRAGRGRRAATPSWRTIWRCTSPPATRATVTMRRCAGRGRREGARDPDRAGPGRGQAAGDRCEDGRGRLRKSLGEITLLGQAFVKDPIRRSRSC